MEAIDQWDVDDALQALATGAGLAEHHLATIAAHGSTRPREATLRLQRWL